MKKEWHDYAHCIRCHVPMESPEIKRVITGLWYLEISACEECKTIMLAMENPRVIAQIDGECLKMLLTAKTSQILVATCEKVDG